VRGHDLALRPLDSDLFVAAQIFGWQEYDPGSDIVASLNRQARTWRADGMTPVIVDAGANVGYSSLYFAATYPEATVLAIEPDPESFDQLLANCAAAPRIRGVCAALWSHDRGVSLNADDGPGSWSRKVAGAGATPSRTLPGLLAEIPHAQPLILKFDIEGAEREACAAAGEALRGAACIMIEPHDFMLPGSSCLAALYEALSGRQVDTLIRGENLIIYDSALVPAKPAEALAIGARGPALEGKSQIAHTSAAVGEIEA
jgi:FkbM family methyltransferase